MTVDQAEALAERMNDHATGCDAYWEEWNGIKWVVLMGWDNEDDMGTCVYAEEVDEDGNPV